MYDRPPVHSNPSHERLPSSVEQTRGRILQQFQEGPLGRWFLALGLTLSLNANGCITTRVIHLPEIPGHTAEGLRGRQAAINQALGRVVPLLDIHADRLPPEATPRLPEIRGFRELAGYEEGTIRELLNTYPQFMVDSRNTSVVRFAEETDYMHPGYGEGFRDIREDGYATVSDPEHPSEAVVTRDALHGDDPVAQTERVVEVITHELVHPTESAQAFYAPGMERLNSYYELLEISSDTEGRVPFAYSTGIRNPDPHLQAIYTATEYHAEAITAALSIEVQEGEDWTSLLIDYFVDKYHIPPERARRTALYAINYIARRDPNYDQARAYAERQRVIQRLIEQRRANRAQTDPVLRSRPFSNSYAREQEAAAIRRTQEEIRYRQSVDRFIDHRLQELREWNENRIRQGDAYSLSREELVNRAGERLVGHWDPERALFSSVFGSEYADRLVGSLDNPERLANFLDSETSFYLLPERIPAQLRQERQLDAVYAWEDYVFWLKIRSRFIAGFRSFRTTAEIEEQMNTQRRGLERAYRRSGIAHSPHHRAIFRAWAEHYLLERLAAPGFIDVRQ